MSDTQTVPGGYFRMPNSWLLLPLSPGAKTLLAYFCSQARDHGVSYNSFNQLGAIVGRAKSTVCGYVKELREAGLIRAQEQKRRDGSNYRLKIFIVGWAEIVGQMGAKKSQNTQELSDQCAQSTERPVPSTERSDPKGHKTTKYKNNTKPSPFARAAAEQITQTKPQSVLSEQDQFAWREFRLSPKDPFHVHSKKIPDRAVAQRTRDHVAYLEELTGAVQPGKLGELIEEKSRAFVRDHKIKSDENQLSLFAQAVRQQCISIGEVDAFFSELKKSWKPAWRQISTPNQVKATYQAAEIKTHRPRSQAYEDLMAYRAHLRSYDYARKNEPISEG